MFGWVDIGKVMIVLETPRLILRQLTLNDLEAVTALDGSRSSLQGVWISRAGPETAGFTDCA
jgi:hypothetical protein